MLAIIDKNVFHPRLAMLTYSTWSLSGTKVKFISWRGGHTRQSVRDEDTERKLRNDGRVDRHPSVLYSIGRQVDKQAKRQAKRQADRQRGRQTGKQTRQTERQTDKQRGKQANKQANRQTGKQVSR